MDKQQREFNKRWKERGVLFESMDKGMAECWYFMGRSDEHARCSDNEFYTGRYYKDFSKEDVKRTRERNS